jgi:MoxR-like ATPase
MQINLFRESCIMQNSDLQQLIIYLNQQIVGQEQLIERLIIALLAGGHLLVEGAPGLAKTKAIKTLAECIEGDYKRIQFTPDLLPADLTGTDVYRPQDGSFQFQRGPLFHNIILADEINRAPAKVQSALLEAMAEKQITVGMHTYSMPALFMVMATQNPIEQEGTYPLPEAQLDRFLLYVRISYPSAEAEQKILRLNRAEALQTETIAKPYLKQADVFAMQQAILQLHMSPEVEQYLVQLIMATRHPEKYSKDLAKWVEFGASPRGTIGLDRAARAHAFLRGQDYVTPSDIHAVVHEVLRHRILLSYEAEAEGISTDKVITDLLNLVAIP